MNKESNTTISTTCLGVNQFQTRNGQLWPPHPYYYVSGSARATRMTIEASSYQTTPSCSPPRSPRCESCDRSEGSFQKNTDPISEKLTKEHQQHKDNHTCDSTCKTPHSDSVLDKGRDYVVNLDLAVKLAEGMNGDKESTLIESSPGKCEMNCSTGKDQ